MSTQRCDPTQRPPLQLVGVLEELEARSIDYVLTGSIVLVAYGADFTPNDLDVTPALDEANLRRLGVLLDDLGAIPAHHATGLRVSRSPSAGNGRAGRRAKRTSIISSSRASVSSTSCPVCAARTSSWSTLRRLSSSRVIAFGSAIRQRCCNGSKDGPGARMSIVVPSTQPSPKRSALHLRPPDCNISSKSGTGRIAHDRRSAA